MKKTGYIFLAALLMAFSIFASACQTEIEQIEIPDGYERVDILDANRFKLEGIGTQFDAHFWSPDNQHLTDDDWAIWLERLDIIKMDHVRIKILPDWYEIDNDNDDPDVFDFTAASWDNPYMNALYKMLDACQERDIKVNLSFYGLRNALSTNWLACKTSANWVSAPTDLDEFAETVYAGLYYLTETKGYTVINETNFYPEPELNYLNESGRFVLEDFYECCKKINEKLKKEGMRDRFIISGAAEVAKYTTFKSLAENIDDVMDKYTGSWYAFNNANTNAEMVDGTKAYAELAASYDKPYGTSEFGSNLPKPPLSAQDIDTYERALYAVRFPLNALSAGFSCVSYWVFGDVYYDSTLNEFGLFKHKNEGWATRPQFYTYGLLTRYTEQQSTIHKTSLKDDDLLVTAFMSPNGKWSYFIANSGKETRNISIVNEKSNIPSSLKKYEVTEESLPTAAVLPEVIRTYDLKVGVVSLDVKPMSFVVLTNLEY